MEINRELLAWAAGFFDGEGHTNHTARKTPRDYIQMTVAQSGDSCPVELMKFQKAVGIGNILGPYTHKTGLGKKPFWCWKTAGFENCQAVIAMLWFQLSDTKRAQAKNALEKYKDKKD